MNRALGAHVLARHPTCASSLEHPELNVHVEVLPGEAFVYGDRRPGPGGLPVGSSGTVAALLSGGIDSPVAAWRLMKRGCRVVFVHFHSVPYLPGCLPRQGARARPAAHRRGSTTRASSSSPSARSSATSCSSVPGPARVVVYRRLMVRIAEALARAARAPSRSSPGRAWGRWPRRRSHNLARIDEVADLPILRPLIGMDKLEITDQAQALGTFEISIEPDADCCTLFVPKHPGTRMSREEVLAFESRLDIPRSRVPGRGGGEPGGVRLSPRRGPPAPHARALGPGAGSAAPL